MIDKYYRARAEATLALIHVEEGIWAKEALDKLSTNVDKGLATEIIYGTLQNLLFIDHILSFYLKHPLQKLTPPIRNILRSAVYQLNFLDRVPAKKVIFDSVRLAGRYGHKGVQSLVSGVLNNIVREKKWTLPDDDLKRLSLQYSHPEWIVSRWLEELGLVATEQLLAWNNQRQPLCLRVNTLVNSAQDYMQKLTLAGVDYKQDPEIKEALYLSKPGEVTELPGYNSGAFQPQSKASMLVALILDPKPGEKVADFCAAPGTKTGHIAELMANQGQITAIDISEERLTKAKENLARLQVTNVKFLAQDATKVDLELQDKILVDAPCSGLGTLSHRPDARYQKTETSLQGLPEIQLAILKNAARHLKPGGEIVYSTCTTEKRENAEVVENFLREHEDFFEVEKIPFRGLIKQSKGYMSWPQNTKTDGFYYCRLKKKPNK